MKMLYVVVLKGTPKYDTFITLKLPSMQNEKMNSKYSRYGDCNNEAMDMYICRTYLNRLAATESRLNHSGT